MIRIRTSYAIITEESAEQGDYAETGWHDEEGFITNIQGAIKFLENEGACYASSSDFHQGIWYSNEGNTDYFNGDNTQYSYHIDNACKAEEETIFNAVTR